MSNQSTLEVLQHVRAALERDEWTDLHESSVPADLFGNNESDAMLHQAYAVGMPSSAPAQGDRQRAGHGLLLNSRVQVLVSFNIPAKGQREAYATFLGQIDGMIAALVRRNRGTGIHLRVLSVSREVVSTNWLIGTVTLEASHRLPAG